jgi:hypothetical protein
MKQFEKRMMSAIERESAMTLPQEQRAWNGLEEQYGPSQAVTEHQFPNGYSVQRHDTIGDIRRVGEMTRNCWQAIGSQGNQGDLAAHGFDQKLKSMSPSYQDDYHALHDEHGIPRAVWLTNENGVAQQITGQRNRPVNPEYTPMIQEWAQNTGRSIDPYDDPYHDQFA